MHVTSDHPTFRPAALVACHDCDAVYRDLLAPVGVKACCRRCGAELYRGHGRGIARPLAYVIAATILFVIANVSPIMGLDFEGARNSSTLLGAVQALYEQEMRLLALLVLLTTAIIPALDLAAMLYLLLPVYCGVKPPGFAPIFRAVQQLKPWGMVEVFLLGVLVALVKLAHMATVAPGIALWAYAGAMLLLTLTATEFEPRELWARVE